MAGGLEGSGGAAPPRASSAFSDPGVAARYESWYSGPGRRTVRLEKRLLASLLSDFDPAASVLDVGCGTGHFTRWFARRGLRVTGLDNSRPMLEAMAGGRSFRRILGDAHRLPFADGSFDIVALITVLEFVIDPLHALREAARVARRGLILGDLNAVSLLAVRRRLSRRAPWTAARFFTIRTLLRIVRAAAPDRIARVRWRTTLSPIPFVLPLSLPFGAFIGLSVHLHPPRPGVSASDPHARPALH